MPCLPLLPSRPFLPSRPRPQAALCHFDRAKRVEKSPSRIGKKFPRAEKCPRNSFSLFFTIPTRASRHCSVGNGRGRTGLSLFAREASRPAGAGLRILRRRCLPSRNTVAGPPETCRPGTIFGFLLHIAFQVCSTLGHLQRSAAHTRHSFARLRVTHFMSFRPTLLCHFDRTCSVISTVVEKSPRLFPRHCRRRPAILLSTSPPSCPT